MVMDARRDAPPSAPQPIEPGVLFVIRQSAAQLARSEYEFIRQLHYDIRGLLDSQATSRSPDLWVFCQRIVQSLLWVALSDQPLPVVIRTLRRVGAQNWADGFPDAQYASVAHALVQTIHYLSGSDRSASTGSAWISFFMWARPHLLAGAQQAAAGQAAAQQAAAERAAQRRAIAEEEAARVASLARQAPVVPDVNLESVASLLDDDDEDTGLGQIMLSMTRNPRRDPPRHADLLAVAGISRGSPDRYRWASDRAGEADYRYALLLLSGVG